MPTKFRWLWQADYILLDLMREIVRTHASTRATSLMRVKRAHATYVYDTYCLRHWNKENERPIKSNLIADQFSLTFVNLSLAWMFYFHVWLQNKGKFLVWREYYNQFGTYQRSHVSLFEPQQSILTKSKGIFRNLSTI